MLARLLSFVALLSWGCATKEDGECNIDKPDCPAGTLCWRAPGAGTAASCVTSAAADQGCKKSPACVEEGDCSFNTLGGGFCEPRSDADCKASQICKRVGECTLKDGVCLVTSDADCEQSEACKLGKRCKLNLEALKPECAAPQ